MKKFNSMTVEIHESFSAVAINFFIQLNVALGWNVLTASGPPSSITIKMKEVLKGKVRRVDGSSTKLRVKWFIATGFLLLRAVGNIRNKEREVPSRSNHKELLSCWSPGLFQSSHLVYKSKNCHEMKENMLRDITLGSWKGGIYCYSNVRKTFVTSLLFFSLFVLFEDHWEITNIYWSRFSHKKVLSADSTSSY